ncbi:hypothetical protein GW7_00971 [Heterocephalus glaber]|uniref:Uncharacterized protein n=1 Tax=Heterocephalus glaber TaxID=10181 RepID=G5C827_HETGA|nr:hypothetical protein GW7_00971 [Heterocephalus glaber]
MKYEIFSQVANTASDIQPLLLHCDTLSAAQEPLCHPDTSFSSQLQSVSPLTVDKGPEELPEEFEVQVPKEHRLQPKLLVKE